MRKLTHRDAESISLKTGIGELKIKNRINNHGLSVEEAISMGDKSPVDHSFQLMALKFHNTKLVNV